MRWWIAAPLCLVACSDRIERTEAWSRPEIPLGVVAHGLGTVDGIQRSNTLEAFRHSVQSGVRWMEVDLHLTDDGDLVCFHSLSEAKIGLTEARVDDIPTREFLRRKHRGGLTLITFEALLRELQRHDGAVLVTDTKEWESAEVDAFLRHLRAVDPKLMRRIVAQIYHPSEARHINRMQRELGSFRSLIFTLYRTDMDDEEVVAWVRQAGIPMVAMRKDRVTADFVAELHATGARVLAYVVTSPNVALRFAGLGVDAIYTGALLPKVPAPAAPATESAPAQP